MPAPARPVRVGVQITNQHATYAQIRDAVRRAEDLGVDVIFNWDHFFPLSGDPDGAHLEAWTMLGAIAEQTDRVEFGPLVNCTAYRNPDLQADMARTVDHISAQNGVGRFIFGTGAGWFERDFVDYGYGDFGTPGSRLDRLAADLPRIRARWAELNPAPTRRIPILIGGKGERKTLRIVAEHADIWHAFVPPAELERKLGVLREHCAAIGRDAGEIELSTGDSIRGLNAIDRPTLDAYRELGVTLFELAIDATDDFGPIRELVRWRDAVA